MKKTLVSVLLTACLATPAAGQAGGIVTWINGHSYEAVASPNVTWFQARDQATSMILDGLSGHLATLATRAEQEFVIANLGGGTALNAFWLGGYQDPADPGYSEPAGGWKWITGEPWLGVATNDPVIPRSDYGFNNLYFDGVSAENYTITWWNSGAINDYYYAPDPRYGDASGGPSRGFLVEFETTSTPEPATLLLLGPAFVGLLVHRRRAHR